MCVCVQNTYTQQYKQNITKQSKKNKIKNSSLSFLFEFHRTGGGRDSVSTHKRKKGSQLELQVEKII